MGAWTLRQEEVVLETTGINVAFGNLYKAYSTSSLNMYKCPCHLDMYQNINKESLKVFTEIISNSNLWTTSDKDSGFLMKFLRLKTTPAQLSTEIPLALIHKYIEEVPLGRTYSFLTIFCFEPDEPPEKPPTATETWKLLLKILSLRVIEYDDSIFDEAIRNLFSYEVIKQLTSEDDEETRALLFGCSIFGNTRFSWLLNTWQPSTGVDLFCLILSTTRDVGDPNLLKILEKKMLEKSGNILTHSFILGSRLRYDSPVLSWKCMYKLYQRSIFNAAALDDEEQ